ncbi:hypothetical protein ScPMuIL_011924 [Solemya velum]
MINNSIRYRLPWGGTCSSDKNFVHDFGESVPRLKIALVGDPEVGKTSIFMRYLKNQFSPLYVPTKKPGIETVVRKVNIPSHTIVSLTLWDIPGREDIDLYKTYFTDLDAAIVVVDLTDESTIEMALIWRQIILNNALVTQEHTDLTKGRQLDTDATRKTTPVDKDTFPVLLLGNKYDVIEQRILDDLQEKQGKKYLSKEGYEIARKRQKTVNVEKPEVFQHLERTAKEHGFVGGVMVSARDPDGSVEDAIKYLTRHLLESKYRLSKWKTKEKDNTKTEHHDKNILHRTGLQKSSSRHLGAIKLILMIFQQSTPLVKLVRNRAQNPKDVKVILRYFNSKVSAAAEVVLREGPKLTASLQELEMEVSRNCEASWNDIISANETPFLKLDRRQLSSQVEENRAIIKHSCEQARTALEGVRVSVNSIQSARMW